MPDYIEIRERPIVNGTTRILDKMLLLPIEYKGKVKRKHVFYNCWYGHYHSTNNPNSMFK